MAGSAIVDGNEITFVATGSVLAADTYTVTLRSAADGIREAGSGDLLDGNGDGLSGGDFVTTFDMASDGSRVLSLPDFARGPGQSVNVPATASGMAIRIDDITHVTAVDFTLDWDPALLNVNGVNLAPTLVAAGWSLQTNISTQGRAIVSLYATSATLTGAVDLVELAADVPYDAPYGTEHVLRLESLRVNEGQIPVIADQAMHKVAFLGDASRGRSLSRA